VFGTGRELFASFRAAVGPADEGASVFLPPTSQTPKTSKTEHTDD